MAALVPLWLRDLLPPYRRNDPEAFVYAHYFVPDLAWHYYVTNGTPRGREYELFGLLLPSEHEEDWSWARVMVSDLERIAGAERDEGFVPGWFPDAVPYPFG